MYCRTILSVNGHHMICESGTTPPSAVSQYHHVSSIYPIPRAHPHQWLLLALQLERLDLTLPLLRELCRRDFREGFRPEPSSKVCRLRKVKRLWGSERILRRKGAHWECGELFVHVCSIIFVPFSGVVIPSRTASEMDGGSVL